VQQLKLESAPKAPPPHVSGRQGQLKLNEAIYTPIIERLSDHKPCTIGEIAQAEAQLWCNSKSL
jgi:hypothetical protein